MAYDPNGFEEYLRRNELMTSAQQQQAQGLAGILGGGLAGQLGQRNMQQGPISNYLTPLREQMANAEGMPAKPKTIREELQLETDEWLKDTI